MLHCTMNVNIFRFEQRRNIDHVFHFCFAFELDQTSQIEYGEPPISGIRGFDFTVVVGRRIWSFIGSDKIFPAFDIVRFLFEHEAGDSVALTRQDTENFLTPRWFNEDAVCDDREKNDLFDVQAGGRRRFFDETFAVDEILVQRNAQKPLVSKLVGRVFREDARNASIPIVTVVIDDYEVHDVFGHQPLILYKHFIKMFLWRGVFAMLMHLGYIFLWWFIAGVFGLLNEMTLVMIAIAYTVYINMRRRGNSLGFRAAHLFKRSPPKGFMPIEDHNEIVMRMTETIQDVQRWNQHYKYIIDLHGESIIKLTTELNDLRHEIAYERNNVRLEKIRYAEVEKKLNNALATATYGLLYVYLHNRERFEEMVDDFKAKEQQEQEPPTSDADETFENKTWWEILGVSQDATRREINTAFRNLSHKYHPDVSDHPAAEELFKRLSAAREEGLKQAKRAA